MADAPLHSGHRDRVKEKYQRDGIENFNDHLLMMEYNRTEKIFTDD